MTDEPSSNRLETSRICNTAKNSSARCIPSPLPSPKVEREDCQEDEEETGGSPLYRDWPPVPKRQRTAVSLSPPSSSAEHHHGNGGAACTEVAAALDRLAGTYERAEAAKQMEATRLEDRRLEAMREGAAMERRGEGRGGAAMTNHRGEVYPWKLVDRRGIGRLGPSKPRLPNRPTVSPTPSLASHSPLAPTNSPPPCRRRGRLLLFPNSDQAQADDARAAGYSGGLSCEGTSVFSPLTSEREVTGGGDLVSDGAAIRKRRPRASEGDQVFQRIDPTIRKPRYVRIALDSKT
ncbi:hypothetical protein VPH35_049255 [Triticum aestivum]|uniref:Uncharacterized protein n=1 Tax=Triticum aestivum TaxID=4565 RepID=A0A077RPK3_WHEAT|nr:unnamed protein product [Triticum aestivum]